MLDFGKAENKEPKVEKTRCPRCNGTGRVRRYKHIDGGKCFSCDGYGHVWLTVEVPVKPKVVALEITLQRIRDQAPLQDCFSYARSSFDTQILPN